MVHFNADERINNKKLPQLEILTKSGTAIDPEDDKAEFENGDVLLIFHGDFEYKFKDGEAKIKKGKIDSIEVEKNGEPDWQIHDINFSAKKFFNMIDDGKLEKLIENKIFDDKDKVWGSNFDDKLFGFDGNDTINGWRGNDEINGGKGKDKLTGFIGDDAFVFDTNLKKNNVDTIKDFNHKLDSIWLDRDIFSGFEKGKLTEDDFASGKPDADAPQIIYKEGKGKIYYDDDGTGGSKMQLFAKVDKHENLSHLDFLVI